MRSNLFLPFGKVRMGLRLGGGWKSICGVTIAIPPGKGSAPALANPNKSTPNPRIISSIISKKSVKDQSVSSPCHKHSQIHRKSQIKSKKTGLKWSVMIYPCASVISVFHFRPVDIAEGWGHTTTTRNKLICEKHWINISVIIWCPSAFGDVHRSKMKHWYHRCTRINHHGSF